MQNVIICITYLLICGMMGCDIEDSQNCSFVDIIDESLDKDKVSLVYLCNPETVRYKKMEMILSHGCVKKIINRDFLFYKMDVRRDNFFNELMFSFEKNLFLVLKGDSIISVVRPNNSPSSIVEQLKNYKKYSFSSGINPISLLQKDDDSVALIINKILRLQYQLQKNIITSELFVGELVKTINVCPYFYNKYLLLNESLASKVDNEFYDYSHLDSLSFLEKSLYCRLIQALLAQKNGINTCLKANVNFDCLICDFGKIKKKQKVVHSFLYENGGKVPYIIYDIKSTCGCTVAKWSKKPTLFGDRDSILVEFVGNSLGYFEKQIQISDNSDLQNLCLWVKGEII